MDVVGIDVSKATLDAYAVAEEQEHEAIEAARQRREDLLEQTKRDIEVETRRAIAEIRDEVTNLTILATEKVTRKTLTDADQRRLIAGKVTNDDFAIETSSAPSSASSSNSCSPRVNAN